MNKTHKITLRLLEYLPNEGVNRIDGADMAAHLKSSL